MKLSVILLFAFVLFAHGGDVIIYTSGTTLAEYWYSWSYGGTWSYVDGSTTIQYAMTQDYGSFSLNYAPGWDFYETPTLEFQLKSTGITDMEFQLGTFKGIPFGNTVKLNNFIANTPAVFPTDSWVQVSIPLNFPALNFDVNQKAYLFYINTIAQMGTLQFKNLKLAGAAFSTNVNIQIDAANILRQINTGIYGVNFATKDQLTRVGYTSNRKGGNAETRYNWERDINNRAIDHFYQNVPNPVADEKKLPAASSANTFVKDTLAAGSIPMMQFTTIGWTCVNNREKRCGFDEKKYGEQTVDECQFSGNAEWCTKNCGNGILLNGKHVTGNDPRDTSMATDQSYAVKYIQHLKSISPVNYFFMDNEPGLWHETHIDVHPNPVSYDEIWGKIQAYGSAIKSAVSGAQLLGPSSWNFCEYLYSPADGMCVQGPDFYAHGNVSFSEYLMKQMAAYKTQTGVSLLDFFDIHYYPDGLFPDRGNNNPEIDARRLRSLKSLYDPRYNDESWLGLNLETGPTQLRVIPRFREYIAKHAPWLKLSISEYNWGDSDRIVQALCQIEALAIFAREGVQLAQRFQAPAPGGLIEKAFYFMMDYDGTKAKYSGNAVSATSSNVDMLPVYSAISQQQNLFYIVLLNKDPLYSYTATMNISNVYLKDRARVFVLQATGFSLSSLPAPVGGVVTITVPSYSAYMIVYDINGGQAATGTTFPSYNPDDGLKNSANVFSATFTLAVTFLLFFFVFF